MGAAMTSRQPSTVSKEPSARLLPLVLEDVFQPGISHDARQLERYLKLIEQRIVALPYKLGSP